MILSGFLPILETRENGPLPTPSGHFIMKVSQYSVQEAEYHDLAWQPVLCKRDIAETNAVLVMFYRVAFHENKC